MKTFKFASLLLLSLVITACGVGKNQSNSSGNGNNGNTKPPSVQVVNNSGGRIDRVIIGAVTFTQNLSYNTSLYPSDNGSYCGDGCSTGFFDIVTGSNNVAVYATSASVQVSLGALGAFDTGNSYAVNIRKVGGNYCAELWKRLNTNSIFNSDTTRVQISTTCGGASVPIGGGTVIPLVIPSVTIAVDGSVADWSGISALAMDPQNDSSAAYIGDDVKALYIAKDATNLYVRMELWESVNTNFWNYPSPNNGRYGFEIINNGTSSQMYLGVAYDNTLSQWSVGFNGGNGAAPSSLQGTSFVGVSGSSIELRVPLVDIGNPTAFYSVRGEANDCCVYNPNYNPPSLLDDVVFSGINQSAVVYIEGHVYATGTTVPIAGAVVSTSLDGQIATTDANGYFFLQTGVVANYSTTPYTISITATGLTPFSLSWNWGDHPINQIFHM